VKPANAGEGRADTSKGSGKDSLGSLAGGKLKYKEKASGSGPTPKQGQKLTVR
jgi:FKBP-type peptidyl-prolyl cis-trans isomerase